jgi:xylitol oxidase
MANEQASDKETAIAQNCKGCEKNLVQNWNGNVNFGGDPRVPTSLEELCHIIRDASPPIRVVGRGHSFTPLAECSGGTLLSLSLLNKILDFSPPSSEKLGSITVQGGTTYTEIAHFLGKRGALQNLPSCPQFTVAGAIATATHGSGVSFQNLSANISMLEFVTGDGTLVRYSRDDDKQSSILEGCRVHLGCLGVVSKLTLDVVPYYEVESFRYDNVSLESMIEHLPDLWKSCDSLSIWTSGFGHGHGKGFCWSTFRFFVEPHEIVKQPPLAEAIIGDTGTLNQRSINRYCADANDVHSFTPTGRGPWYDSLTLTLLDGKETTMTTVDLQAEFFVPLECAQDAISKVWQATREWTFSSPHGYDGNEPPIKGLVDAMEFRQIKGGDGAWLSPHPVDSLGIHVSFNGNPTYRADILETYVPCLEAVLEPFSVRAHWGKLAPMSFSRVEEVYGEGLQRFRDLCELHDPTGKFRNAHVNRMLFNTGACFS